MIILILTLLLLLVVGCFYLGYIFRKSIVVRKKHNIAEKCSMDIIDYLLSNEVEDWREVKNKIRYFIDVELD